MDKPLNTELWEAISSNEVDKVRHLLQNISTSDEADMESLAMNFEVIMFKNVPIDRDIVYLISSKLMDHRFFFPKDDGQCPQEMKLTVKNVLTRIHIIKEHTDHIANNHCDGDYDFMFSLRARIISHHMEVLKKFLKSTYYSLPWEEMQFCLLMFVVALYARNEEVCTMYKLVLDRKRLVTFLVLFTEVLCDVGAKLGKKDLNSKVRLPSCKTLIKSVTDRTPGFHGLYADHEIVRDIYSLTKITYYIQESLELDHGENLQLKKLAIQRALQVLGEHLKNSPESPNVSPNVHSMLMRSAPSGLKEVAISLRNTLSHSYSLLGRMQVEDEKNTLFFTLQNELQFIQSDIYVALNEVKIAAILAFLEKIRLASNVEEVKYLLTCFGLGNVKFHRSPDFKVPMKIVDDIGSTCSKIDKNIPDKTDFESTLFEKVFELLAQERQKNENAQFQLESLLRYLSHIVDNVNYQNDLTCIKRPFVAVDKAVRFFKGKPCNYYKQIRHLLYSIYTSLINRNSVSYSEIQEIDKLVCILHANVTSMTTAEEFKMNIDADHIYEVDAERHVDRMIETISSLTMSKQLREKIKKGLQKKKLIHKIKSQCNMVIVVMLRSQCYANSEACNVEWKTLIRQLETKKETEEELLRLQKNKNIEGCKRLLNLIDDSYAMLCKSFKDYSLFMDKNKRNALNQFLLSLKLYKCDVEHITTMFDERLLTKVKVIYKDRLNVLKTVLDEEHILSKVFNDEALQLAIETLVLDLLEILEKLSFCGNNIFVVDDYATSITGKTFRNYLAHGNIFLEILPANTVMSLICTAFKLVECGEGLLDMKDLLIGKITVPDDDFIKRRYLHMVHHVNLQTAMLSYAAKDDCDSVKESIEKGASALGSGTDGLNILQRAANANSLECFKFGLQQLQSSKHINHNTQLLLTLHLAATHGSDKIINHYIENHLDLTGFTNGTSLLHILAENGHADIIRTLISKHAFDVHVYDNHKASPLHLAAAANHLEVVKLLLSHGCSITDRCLCTKTPLHKAARNGHAAIVNLLLNHHTLPDNLINEGKCLPLHLAAENGHADVISLLLRHGADPSSLNVKRMTALQISVSNGHLDVVKLLFGVTLRNESADGQLDSYAIEELKMQILLTSSIKGNAAILRFLIDEGMSVEEACTRNGTSLIQVAIQACHRDVVNMLIAAGANVNWRNFKGQTPLHFACEEGHGDIVDDLLAAGAQVNAVTRHGLTPLCLAALCGHTAIVDMLVNNGADVNLTMFDCITPLHAAAWSQNVQTVNCLLEKGAKVNAQSFNGTAPLHLAARKGNRDVVRALLRSDTLLDVEDGEHLTPLHIACREGHAVVVRMLLKRGAKMDGTTVKVEQEDDPRQLYETVLGADSWCQSGSTFSVSGVMPVHLAAYHGHADVVAMLMDNGAAFDAEADNGMTPLEMACQQGHLKVVGLLKRMGARFHAARLEHLLFCALHRNNHKSVFGLLKLGVSVNAANSEGWSVLHQAACIQNVDAVHLFLAGGAAVDRRCVNGETPLHSAVQSNNEEIVRVLLRHGADPNARCNKGETPVDAAVRLNMQELIEILCEAGGKRRSSNDNCEMMPQAVENGGAPMSETVLYGENTDATSVPHGDMTEEALEDGGDLIADAGSHGEAELVSHGEVSHVKSVSHGEVNDVTSVSHGEGNSVTSVSHGEGNGVTLVSHGEVNDVTSMSHGEVNGITSVSHGEVSDVTSVSHGEVTGVISVSHGEVNGVTSVSHGEVGSDVASGAKITVKTNTYTCCDNCTFTSVTCINCGAVFHRLCAERNSQLLVLDDARVVCCGGDEDEKVKSLYARIDTLMAERNLWKKRFEDSLSNIKLLRWNNKLLTDNLQNINVVIDTEFVENPIDEKFVHTSPGASAS